MNHFTDVKHCDQPAPSPQRATIEPKLLLRRERKLPGLQKLLIFLLAGLVMLLAAGPTPGVHAATITVDGVCTLANAITAANTDAASGSCPAGSGADTLDLQTNVTLTAVLPNITSAVTIEGNSNTISGNNLFRVLTVTGGGNLTLNRTTIADGNGVIGGILVESSTLTVNQSTVRNNNGSNSGGLRVYNSTVTIDSSTIHNNTSPHNGGGIFIVGDSGISTVTLNNSTVSTNQSTLNGAGIYNSSAGLGGAATLTLNYTTVVGNISQANGGGLYNTGSGSLASVNRSIISGNSSVQGSAVFNQTGTVTGNNYNILSDNLKTTAQAFSGFAPGGLDINAASDAGNIALASILSSLSDNGGPTLTHPLVPGSPAIDLIPTTDGNCNPGSSVDQRGAARANGPSQGDSACDSGAYEVSAETPTAITLQIAEASAGQTQWGLLVLVVAALSAVSLMMVYRRRWLPMIAR